MEAVCAAATDSHVGTPGGDVAPSQAAPLQRQAWRGQRPSLKHPTQESPGQGGASQWRTNGPGRVQVDMPTPVFSGAVTAPSDRACSAEAPPPPPVKEKATVAPGLAPPSQGSSGAAGTPSRAEGGVGGAEPAGPPSPTECTKHRKSFFFFFFTVVRTLNSRMSACTIRCTWLQEQCCHRTRAFSPCRTETPLWVGDSSPPAPGFPSWSLGICLF